jgi:RNA-directed DNA polymerase
MALKLVLEPIFEPDQYRSSYAYRPGRRAQDAVAEIVHYINNGYSWVVEGDIEGCFDNIGHSVVVERIRRRVTDRKVISLCKAFLKAGVLTELGTFERRLSGTPQGSLCAAAHKPPYEQRWVMRSARRLPPVRAVVTAERCA